MRWWLGALLCLATPLRATAGPHSIGWGVEPPQAAQKKAAPARFAPFVGTLEEARAHASERNVPLVVCPVLDGEEASDRFAGAVPSDPAYAAALANAVVLIANAGEHPKKQIEELVDGKKSAREVCSVFLTPSCADHQLNWDPVFFAYNEKGELRCPQMIVVLPDGKVARRLAPGDVPKPGQVSSALAALVEKLGPGLTAEGLATVKAALAAAQAALERGAPADAWRAWAEVLAVTQTSRQAEAARTGQAQALTEIAARRDAALALLEGERVVDGYEALVALAASCKGLPNEKELAKLVSQAETKPATRDVIAAHKKTLAAEALWKEIGELEAQNQRRKAEAKVRLLIRKYWDTEAGKRARKAYPEIAKDEDARGG